MVGKSLVNDARVGLGEEDEEATAEDDAEHGANGLGNELHAGRGTEQVTGSQVSQHVYGLGCRTSSHDTSSHVDALCQFAVVALSLCDTAKDELRALGTGGHRVDVGSTRGLCGDEAEDEGQDDGKDGQGGADLVLNSQHDHGKGDGGENASGPDPSRHLLRLWRRVLDLPLLTREVLRCKGTRLGDLLGRLKDGPLETAVEDGAVHRDLGEGGTQHDHDANPQVPVSWRRLGLGIGQ